MAKIDLVCFNSSSSDLSYWTLGGSYNAGAFNNDTVVGINIFLKDCNADWVLFWDYDLGSPDINLIETLIAQNVDAWHAGLKLGLQGMPDALNYINPAWVYNKDAKNNIVSSSFRLSFKACLIKTNLLRHVGYLPTAYGSIEMIGLAAGYEIIKRGGIIRYHPQLVKKEIPRTQLPETDEWIFTRRFFPKKWSLWLLFNRKGLLKNYKSWTQTRHISYSGIRHDYHASNIKTERPAKEILVSVLAPTLDRYSYLENELEQLDKQTIGKLEVLITDQTQLEKRQSIDFSKYANLTVKYFPQSGTGQCIAWNKLLEEAKGEYVLFLGDDADNIKPDFIEKLLDTATKFNADIVASNVVELKMPAIPVNHYYYMSDTFPITLAKREVILQAGSMDMYFDKNIRADYDLALRCHENGALMIFDSSALIDHHRAPVGGLRTHNARAITNKQAKTSITKFTEPTASEIFLVKRHFNDIQYRNYIRIKYFDQLVIKGDITRKAARIALFMFRIPSFMKRYKINKSAAEQELKIREQHNTKIAVPDHHI